MSRIYYLQHKIDYLTRSHRKAIGVYSHLDLAVAAIKRLHSKSGFSDPRGRFAIFACDVDRSYWPEGVDRPGNEVPAIYDGSDTSRSAVSVKGLYCPFLDKADEDDASINIGFYSSRDTAESALEHIRGVTALPSPWEFEVGYSPVNSDGWVDGFIIAD